MNFVYYESKFFCVRGKGAWRGGGLDENEFFLQRIQI